MNGLESSDAAAAAVQKTPNRVSLADIEGKIAAQYIFTADKAIGEAPAVDSLKVLTICIIVMQNGFTVIGTSAPADADNFNAELGAQFARENAVRQIWPLEGYSLRDRLAAGRA